MRRLAFALLVVLAVLAALVWAGTFDVGPIVITREGEQKIVLFLSRPISIRREPGLSFRPPIPVLTQVLTFDARWLYVNVPPSSVPTRDQERVVVDNYAIWRIDEPLRFFESFPGGVLQAQARINDVVTADVREVVGQHTLADLLGPSRVAMMERITRQTNESLGDSGIDVRDVRVNRTELPLRTVENVFARMRTEREREARKLRAEGEEEGRRIRAEADREARVTVAEGRRDAEMVRGDGDAQAAAIYAAAYSADPEFFGFVRSLEAYRKTIGPGTTLVLPPDSEFFRILDAPQRRR